ncbi:protein dissatisfaction [Venturia canescens]|uniref:protein dissatisfaction n=1 Tax=Venturia canescens TaxID=32260 RepID=UPI001C9BD007|nr:protein dissatisfaction-like [Venturia canescens]
MGTGDRLLDIPCKVCDDRSSGKHYGIYSCDGCSGFFKRSIHNDRKYTCKSHEAITGHCPIDKIHRNQCRACRLNKCFQVGMNRDVQHERGPRKPKPHPGMAGKLPHSVTPTHHEVAPRVDLNSNSLSHHRTFVSQLSPPLVPNFGRDAIMVDINAANLSHHRRMRCAQRPSPYSRPVSRLQKPPDDSTSPTPLALQYPPPYASLSHPAAFAFGQQPPLLQIIMSAEKYQESVWKSRPDAESSFEHTESETSRSPDGTLPSAILTWELLQETTARLLFMAVRWVRCLMHFQTLSKDDELLLLRQTWTQLFLLHLAQWSMSRDISGLLDDEQVRRRLPPEQSSREEIMTIKEIMSRFRQLSPDSVECGSMKAVVLFTPETRGLSDSKLVEALQDEAQCGLGEYVRFRYPGQAARFGRFLLLLPSLQAVKPSTVELLFFRETIGAIPIARLLGDMYQMEHHQNADVPLNFRGGFQETIDRERESPSHTIQVTN